LPVVVDIVPNHTGVAVPHENAAWWDVLKLGRGSVYARWFDIDWSRGRLLLPVLGDDFDNSQLSLDLEAPDGPELRYFEHRFPLAAATEPGPGDSAADVHARQHYELVNFRRADIEQNYRRFFAVTTLAGLRVEDRTVFDATHDQIARWVHDDGVAGLRVDHPDGLADPKGYLQWLRELGGEDAWLLVEKILEHGERLPADWPVDGTTGYDALGEAGGLFVDTAAEDTFTALYRELTADDATSAEHIARGKRQAIGTILQAELSRLARLVDDVPGARDALAELVIAFRVYRSYEPDGDEDLVAAVDAVHAARSDLDDAVSALLPRLRDPADELCTRFQQVTGAVMAKGVEDTAYYRYTRFIALNEVGGDPAQFGLAPQDFHAAQDARLAGAPRGMTTLSTHDTKRGEDVRARLAVVSELPEQWTELARSLMTAAPLPDAGFAYLLWQTFVGVGFVERERLHAYAEKAMREAAQSTNWIDPDETFESAVHRVVDAAYDDPALREPLARFLATLAPYGRSNALAQKLVQLTMPGVPDVYQGTELWEDSLVDPDNRRTVDFAERRAVLARLDADGTPPALDDSGAAKLWVTSRALRLRRDRPELFGSYTALRADGAAAEHAVAFDRGGAVTVATRLPVALERAGGWRDSTLPLPTAMTDVLTGRRHEAGDVAVASVLETYPVALLVPA
jgi:(1->4)-alpha-D-glucan 1-alpha-D-glucosylmutase